MSNCPRTLMEHCEELVVAMAAAGIGGGCEDTYRSLLEVADWIQRAHGFPAYTCVQVLSVTPDEIAAIAAEKLRQQRLMN